MKKISCIVFAFLLLVSTTGCAKKSKKSATDGVRLSEESITLEVYDSFALKAQAANTTSAQFEWKSSDEAVATVKDGVVTANQTGEATVTASFGGRSGACKVTVIKNTHIPVLTLRSELELAENSKFVLRPVLQFKGEVREANGYVWQSSDPSVATVNDGEVRAVSVGQTFVTATTQAFGEVLSATVAVTVKSDLSLIFEEESVTLYKPGTSDEGTTHAASYSVVTSGDVPSGQVVWSSDDERIATVDSDGNIAAVGKGSTFIRINGTFDGIPLSAAMTVTVTVPQRDRPDVVYDFDSKTGDVSDLEDALGLDADEKIEKVYELTDDGVVEYSYFEGSKTLVKSGPWQVGEKRWQVETSHAAYNIRTVVATRVLRTKADILGMKKYNAAVMVEPDYYVLANDIDMEYADCPSLFVNGDSTGTIAWYGTFDGRGHTINRASFLTAWVATAGFFGAIGENSVVKDLAFTNVATDGAYGIFASFIFGTVENIYIDCNTAKIGSTARTTGLFAMNAKGPAVIRNVVVKYGEFSLWSAAHDQCAFINTVGAGAVISDVYAYYYHGSDPSLAKMFMQNTSQQVDADTVKLLSSESEFKKAYCNGWDADIWDIPTADGKMPTFRSR